MKKIPDFNYELKTFKKGYWVIAGLDEVGRGSFAGPVVAACVVFQKEPLKKPDGVLINDSKQLTSRQREKAAIWIKENANAWGIGEVSVSIINRLGMAKATKIAFRRAISDANLKLRDRKLSQIEYLLLDAFHIPFVRGIRRKNQLAIVDGDAKCFSIAGASIIAKVYRDGLMQDLGLDPKYKNYGWGRNKGYGTGQHQHAILKYGLTRFHRKQFVARLISEA